MSGSQLDEAGNVPVVAIGNKCEPDCVRECLHRAQKGRGRETVCIGGQG